MAGASAHSEAAAAAAAGDTVSKFSSLADSLSLDNLQKDFGDPTGGKKSLIDTLDFTYLTPKLASELI